MALSVAPARIRRHLKAQVDDAIPANLDLIAGFGSLGFGQPGQTHCPAELGACCFNEGSCQWLLEAACVAAGGSFRGSGSSCDPNPCPSTESGA